MLILGSRLAGTAIMGLQTGSRLAVTKLPVIDPANLRIIAYEVEGPLLAEHPSYLRLADVRELSNIGMIIDSNDEFIGLEDVISVKNLVELNFRLIGLIVIDEMKHKLGKVVDYSVDANSFIIQQLSVRQGLMKSLKDTELLIHRSQIIEINNTSIIVRANTKKLEPIPEPDKMSYVNPFRSSTPQTNGTNANQ